MQHPRGFHFVLLLFGRALPMTKLRASGLFGFVPRRRPERDRMGNLSLSEMACIVLVFYAATVITGSAQTLTTLHSFDLTDGAMPMAGLVQATDGNFYGTTEVGGGYGTVFKITPSGTLTTLHRFNGTDGAVPYDAELVQATDGNFYGTTPSGGANNNCVDGGCGTVFKITPSGTLTTLYSFCSQPNCTDGSEPWAGLVQARDGNFYGTTVSGGANGYGTIFKITPSGTPTILYSFCSNPVANCPDGAGPYAGLVQATDGNFYGTTFGGGAYHLGTVFKITPSGTLTTLHSFNYTDGEGPDSGLVQATDGNFYGTTPSGGANGYGTGTIFKITPSGTLTTLYTFCSQLNCTDGQQPEAALVQATDGNFYGTTFSGGANDTCSHYPPHRCGTVFKITSSGTLTTLHSFNGADGDSPWAGLVQATDGNFYGTTAFGGANGDGSVFSLSLPEQFVPVTRCRVVDTRNPNGAFGGPPIQNGTYRSFSIPQGNCSIPSSAAAYSLNVTVVPSGSLGYLTIWPTGQNQPLVSTMNSLDGRIKANAAIVPAGANGAVNVYATNTTNVVLDIDGYFAAPGQNTYQFYALTACRVIDTRGAEGPLGGPYLHGGANDGSHRDFPVRESDCIPANANVAAYSMNFTAVPHTPGQPLGYLTVWPEGGDQPVVSTLNNPTATAVANAAIVSAGTGGGISTFVYDDTHLIADINGFFGPAGQNGLSFYPTAPCRVYDSRDHNGQPFRGTRTVNVVGSMCATPGNALAYVLNATVVPANGPMGYLTLWPDGQNQPVVSTLNAYDGFITSNMAIVPNINGSIDAYADGLTQLILDISGYFAP